MLAISKFDIHVVMDNFAFECSLLSTKLIALLVFIVYTMYM